MNPHEHDTSPAYREETQPRFEMRSGAMLALLVVGVVVLAASGYGVFALRSLSSDLAEVVELVRDRTKVIAQIQKEFLLLRVAEKNFIIEDTSDGMDTMEERMTASENRISELLDDLEEADHAVKHERHEELRASFARFRTALEEMRRLGREHTLARAASLSRGVGRDQFEAARLELLAIIEHLRDAIAGRFGAATPEDVEHMTAITTDAREALESFHDLMYMQQAMLTVFSAKERSDLADRIMTIEESIRERMRSCARSDREVVTASVERFERIFAAWMANHDQVRTLAEQDSKGQAMRLSTTAVRGAYTASAEQLDQVFERARQEAMTLEAEHRIAVQSSRAVLFATAGAGLAVLMIVAFIVVRLVLAEYRAAANLLSSRA